MRILLRQARVFDALSKHHGTKKDILIDKGVIQKIAKKITDSKAKVVSSKDLCVSIGWVDLGTYSGDPGYEYREDLASLTKAAARGGYTGIVTLPNTKPTIHSKSEVAYVLNKTKHELVHCHPLGAVSMDCGGTDLAEMYDMAQAGAVAFTDGRQAIQNGGLMLRGLLYVKRLKGLIINRPHDRSIAADGHIHEGVVSTTIGLKGIPTIGENLMLQRDIELTKYADSRYHAMHISSATSVDIVKKAQKDNLDVTTSVAYLNLVATDKELSTFNTSYKVLPPLRLESDRKALIKGLKDETISIISTNHVPVDNDNKIIEFSSAKFGASGLETCFAAINTHLTKSLDIELIVNRLSRGVRSLLNLEQPTITTGEPADLTIFDPSLDFKLDRKDFKSKSSNSPFAGKELKGKVLGVIRGKQAELFD